MNRPLMRDSGPSLLGDTDIHLFNEGTHARLYDKLGSRIITHNGQSGAYFAVWAPNAERVSVIGDFNGWDDTRAPLKTKSQSGIWD
ncbi:MAG TPA: 1,4-alpha-glucan branching enzyme, partial [Polyangia bacterium]|nr:1,4-alpha-glucan branching enzyme [Polyangia bacterium]